MVHRLAQNYNRDCLYYVSNLGNLRKRKRDSEESCDKKILIDNEDQDTKSTFYVEAKPD